MEPGSLKGYIADLKSSYLKNAHVERSIFRNVRKIYDALQVISELQECVRTTASKQRARLSNASRQGIAIYVYDYMYIWLYIYTVYINNVIYIYRSNCIIYNYLSMCISYDHRAGILCTACCTFCWGSSSHSLSNR